MPQKTHVENQQEKFEITVALAIWQYLQGLLVVGVT
jgi:hypothetical protein